MHTAMATMANTLTHTHIYRDGLRHTHTHQCEGFRCTSIHTQKVMDFTIHSHIFTKRWTSLHTHIFTIDGLRYTHTYSQAMDFAVHSYIQKQWTLLHTHIPKRWTSLGTHTYRCDGFRCTHIRSKAMDFAAHSYTHNPVERVEMDFSMAAPMRISVERVKDAEAVLMAVLILLPMPIVIEVSLHVQVRDLLTRRTPDVSSKTYTLHSAKKQP